MMRKNQRFAFLAIGGLGLLAAIAPGLAATISTPPAQSAPAAGQGDVAVLGYSVTDITWTFDSGGTDVETVSFAIQRGTGDVTVTTSNTTVRARLESATEETAWFDCVVAALGDAATCTFPSNDTMDASDVEKVNIIAFDSTS
jgi:hypothetical protein